MLGVDVPVAAFTGQILAVVHRRDDVEEKWVVVPEGMMISEEQIMAAVHFQERFFDSEVKMACMCR